MLLDARAMLQSQRPQLLARLREAAGKRRSTTRSPAAPRRRRSSPRSTVTPGQLTLVETSTMDESVIRGNLKRVVENLCYDELQQLNRGVGFLLDAPRSRDRRQPARARHDRRRVRGRAEGRPDRDADQVPGAEGAEPDVAVRDQRDLRRPEQASCRAEDRPGRAARPVNLAGPADRARQDGKRRDAAGPVPPPVAEVDVMAMFQRMFAGGAAFRPQAAPMAGNPQQAMGQAAPGMPQVDVPQFGAPPSQAPMRASFLRRARAIRVSVDPDAGERTGAAVGDPHVRAARPHAVRLRPGRADHLHASTCTKA